MKESIEKPHNSKIDRNEEKTTKVRIKMNTKGGNTKYNRREHISSELLRHWTERKDQR